MFEQFNGFLQQIVIQVLIHVQHELQGDVLRRDELAVVSINFIHLPHGVFGDQQSVCVIGNRLVPVSGHVATCQSVCDLLLAVVDEVERRADGHSVFECEGCEEAVISEVPRFSNGLVIVSVKREIGLSEYFGLIIIDIVVIGSTCLGLAVVAVGDDEEAVLFDLPDVGHASECLVGAEGTNILEIYHPGLELITGLHATGVKDPHAELIRVAVVGPEYH